MGSWCWWLFVEIASQFLYGGVDEGLKVQFKAALLKCNASFYSCFVTQNIAVAEGAWWTVPDTVIDTWHILSMEVIGDCWTQHETKKSAIPVLFLHGFLVTL